jgi:hypothetical protein
MIDNKLIERVLFRGAGLVGRKNIEEIATKAGIKFSNTGDIELPENIEEAFKKLLIGILKKGGVIAKISLQNMAKQYDFELPKF